MVSDGRGRGEGRIVHMVDRESALQSRAGMGTAITVIDGDEVVRLGVAAALSHVTDFSVHAVHSHAGEVRARRGFAVVGARAGGVREIVPDISALTAKGWTVVLHAADEHPIPLREAITAGARGIALRRDAIAGLLSVMRTVRDTGSAYSSAYAERLCTDRMAAARLSAREADVLGCLSEGRTHRQAARRLGIDEETVKTHLKSVRAKYVALGRSVTNIGTINREARADGWLS